MFTLSLFMLIFISISFYAFFVFDFDEGTSVILGLLVGFLATGIFLFAVSVEDNQKITNEDLKPVCELVAIYKKDKGRYPNSLKELETVYKIPKLPNSKAKEPAEDYNYKLVSGIPIITTQKDSQMNQYKGVIYFK